MKLQISIVHLIIFTLYCSLVEKTKGDHSGLCKFKGVLTHQSNSTESVCGNMSPRNGLYPPQLSASPWVIFTFSKRIEQLHSQPVTLGSTDSKNSFNGYVITVKTVNVSTKILGDIIGHFEPQWDASPICCDDQNSIPNMLESSSARVKLPNQTLLWTAPTDYLGPCVFVATVWKSSRLYWPNITSDIVNVIDRLPKNAAPPSGSVTWSKSRGRQKTDEKLTEDYDTNSNDTQADNGDKIN